MPGIRVAAPRDATRLRELLGAAVADDRGPTAVRYPTGRVGPDLPSCGALGSADLLTPPSTERDMLLLPIGALAPAALDAAARLTDAGMEVAVADPRWIVPVDTALVVAAARHRLVVTIEDNTIGFGDALARGLRTHGASCEVLTLALPTSFAAARDRADLHRRHGVDGAGIAEAVCTHRSTADTAIPRRLKAVGQASTLAP